MINQTDEFYAALVAKNGHYEGVFFAGIKTTGIFCSATCPARKPKRENCEFFDTAQEALLAGYRPCKRCHPMAFPQQESALVRQLIEAVEAEPEKRWSDADFRALGIDSSTVRRQFKKRFGMTFVAYARSRRMGLALQNIRSGEPVIDAQLNAGYESGSGFRVAFSRIMGEAPQSSSRPLLLAEWLDTPLGPMLALADDKALHLLEFTDRRGLEREIERQRKHYAIAPGRTSITDSIEAELKEYYAGKLQRFQTPIHFRGTPFQQTVWQALTTIPYGDTWAYAELAKNVGNPKGFRAVASANGCNQLAIIVPCHRVINADGELGGYAGGLVRKQWLLRHEQHTKRPA
ncbi:bifunctional transcriptional activator/DNA repair enzyme AdaA [Cerasicoccus arenae]|uniref:methylated-DNA--[protein]-cysteine S-methyltransferase n=1 Tax=Cerasicoccus arenae TaxID=424488 RepID=A0A8J3DIN6_9BACT|nr:trifunctional transcriptional activator/DNA repair protein Ada/methylated-DNA--[protein]-cysteine S-methyltransferase [Cerasicoccus arenae]MBK1858592.1 bifunctional transcriptional activator/DNA repair protein Ada [Cerasicoccus arenae]GHC05110.1 6-O-methylguanine DNA methyltransferase [Cerasicoccus arenae]